MPNGTFQFGAFEVNERLGELRKHGVRIRLQEQPFQILTLLLDHAGEVVGREEIRGKLWPDNTFVDFDNAISSAIRKLREALGDSADNPRFIETLAKRGYRFICPIERRSPAPLAVRKRTHIKIVPVAAGMLLLFGAASWWMWTRREHKAAPLTPLPLTAAGGWEMQPSFSPDGNQIAYAWDETSTGSNPHIYVKMIGSGRPVKVTEGGGQDFVPSWSPDGRSIAFARARGQGSAIYLIPPLGGTERKVADGYFIGTMSWSPDGRFLAVADRKSSNDSSSLYLVDSDGGQKVPLITVEREHRGSNSGLLTRWPNPSLYAMPQTLALWVVSARPFRRLPSTRRAPAVERRKWCNLGSRLDGGRKGGGLLVCERWRLEPSPK